MIPELNGNSPFILTKHFVRYMFQSLVFDKVRYFVKNQTEDAEDFCWPKDICRILDQYIFVYGVKTSKNRVLNMCLATCLVSVNGGKYWWIFNFKLLWFRLGCTNGTREKFMLYLWDSSVRLLVYTIKTCRLLS